ncbi:hypothetical protein AZI86_10595 [Bdellovibrio bacteriovorus]|uniref:JmjC domain-containing protein n=1 Tax=Bdellovibrio bacteriovorus TaxID=959 RepID=A0A150WLE9_BDEBC|nr:cupin domain-containing protein [Bdellovibrio bacteriovorus]KYG64655.1 hypothetical protein AZI86_10595 [Bdellovibrio bacteriovorus]
MNKSLAVIDTLLGRMDFEYFQKDFFGRMPLAMPGTAHAFKGVFHWHNLVDVLNTHDNCWAVKEGILHKDLQSGRMSYDDFLAVFEKGYSAVIRHGELADDSIKAIAQCFQKRFKGQVDVQMYATPAGCEGFDWHYDEEDVFVIQTAGVKEFCLRAPKLPLIPQTKLPLQFLLSDYTTGPEIRCQLAAGDWLYIPAGFWHKAKSLEESFHISVGVLNAGL